MRSLPLKDPSRILFRLAEGSQRFQTDKRPAMHRREVREGTRLRKRGLPLGEMKKGGRAERGLAPS